jgi:hypothetical protein
MKGRITTPMMLALFLTIVGGAQLIAPTGKVGVVGRSLIFAFCIGVAYEAGVKAGKAER